MPCIEIQDTEGVYDKEAEDIILKKKIDIISF